MLGMWKAVENVYRISNVTTNQPRKIPQITQPITTPQITQLKIQQTIQQTIQPTIPTAQQITRPTTLPMTQQTIQLTTQNLIKVHKMVLEIVKYVPKTIIYQFTTLVWNVKVQNLIVLPVKELPLKTVRNVLLITI